MRIDAADERRKIEEELENGQLQRALGHTQWLLRETDDGGVQLLRALTECRLEHFDQAQALLENLAARIPQWRQMVTELLLCVAAEREMALRRRDPKTALQRAGIAPPPTYLVALHEAAVHHASELYPQAQNKLKEAEALRPRFEGRIVTELGHVLEFRDIVDSDALSSAILPVIGSRGLVDIPFSNLSLVELRPPQAYDERLWLIADIETRSSATLTMRVPALYPGSGLHRDPEIRNGDRTLWTVQMGYEVGSGQRLYSLETADRQKQSVGLRRIRRIELVQMMF